MVSFRLIDGALTIRVELGVMVMKRNSIFPKFLGVEPHHYMQFSVISRTLVIGYYWLFYRDVVNSIAPVN